MKKVTCPKCGKIGGNAVMHRYHFDKCSVISERLMDQIEDLITINTAETTTKRIYINNKKLRNLFDAYYKEELNERRR